jgi:hypothetical protein
MRVDVVLKPGAGEPMGILFSAERGVKILVRCLCAIDLPEKSDGVSITPHPPSGNGKVWLFDLLRCGRSNYSLHYHETGEYPHVGFGDDPRSGIRVASLLFARLPTQKVHPDLSRWLRIVKIFIDKVYVCKLPYIKRVRYGVRWHVSSDERNRVLRDRPAHHMWLGE